MAKSRTLTAGLKYGNELNVNDAVSLNAQVQAISAKR